MSAEILIIGASGFIGSNLLREFERHSTPIRASSRHPENILSNSNSTETTFLDLSDY